ncbi:hypothetical protein Tco_0002392 [Tanacetum coccineum]
MFASAILTASRSEERLTVFCDIGIPFLLNHQIDDPQDYSNQLYLSELWHSIHLILKKTCSCVKGFNKVGEAVVPSGTLNVVAYSNCPVMFWVPGKSIGGRSILFRCSRSLAFWHRLQPRSGRHLESELLSRCPPYLSHSLYPSFGCHLKIVSECSDWDSDMASKSQHPDLMCQTYPGLIQLKGPSIISASSSVFHLSCFLLLVVLSPGVCNTEYFSIKSAVCRSRTLRRASSSFVPSILDQDSSAMNGVISGRDVVIVVASVLIGGGVTSNDGLEDETSVKGAITGRS